MTDFYDLGHKHAHAGQQPVEEHRDQPYYMHGWNDGRRDYDLYRAYLEDGHSRYAAAVMAGMRDPDEACHD
ncbi:hypothetical protein [Crenobacter cavernae]|uniref:Uncharacterized protein n=1 Tax=Crenobacter cavernae TaxID=2290923 RepID=A0A345Y6U2_9NEIS|nr:hypothetical protein [Crenobacter cavernae]AXK39644.1 hypothetical protein DWG20_09410 [Crenobacter cavernae]